MQFLIFKTVFLLMFCPKLILIAFCAMTWMDIWMSVLTYMLVNDANGKHLVAPVVLYVKICL